jgi:hypothetical protein
MVNGTISHKVFTVSFCSRRKYIPVGEVNSIAHTSVGFRPDTGPLGRTDIESAAVRVQPTVASAAPRGRRAALNPYERIRPTSPQRLESHGYAVVGDG